MLDTLSQISVAIRSIELFPVQLPHAARYRNWAIARGSTAPGDDVNVVVKITAENGTTGFGEVGRYYDGETPASVVRAIRREIAPALAGADATNIASVRQAMDATISGSRFAKSAVEMAIHDLAGRLLGVPVWRLLGGRYRSAIPICPSIGINDVPEAVADQTEAFVAEGYRDLKLKVGLDFERDRKTLELIRKRVGDDFRIRIDPNRAYGPEDALKKLRVLESFDLLMIEQPVEPGNIATLRQLCNTLTTPLVADEGVCGGVDAIALVRNEAAQGVMLKPARCGGLQPARELANVADAAHMTTCVGSLRELGIATAAFIHFAASLPRLPMACNLAGPALFLDDDVIDDMLRPVDGFVEVPEGAGLGIEVDEEKLAYYAVDLAA